MFWASRRLFEVTLDALTSPTRLWVPYMPLLEQLATKLNSVNFMFYLCSNIEFLSFFLLMLAFTIWKIVQLISFDFRKLMLSFADSAPAVGCRSCALGIVGLGGLVRWGGTLGAGAVAVLGVSRMMLMLAPNRVPFILMISVAMVMSSAN